MMDSGISGAELSGSVTSVLAHTILLMLLPVMKALSERCRLWARASNTEAEYSNGRQRDREQCSQLRQRETENSAVSCWAERIFFILNMKFWEKLMTLTFLHMLQCTGIIH
jgi:hypothetical protein